MTLHQSKPETKIAVLKQQPTYHGQPLDPGIKVMPRLMCPAEAISLAEAIVAEEPHGAEVAYFAESHEREGLLVFTSATKEEIDGFLFPVMDGITTARILETFGFNVECNESAQLSKIDGMPNYLSYSKQYDLVGAGA